MDKIEDRLQRFLEMEEITATQFADTMEIQRSGMSHLLSGRNKPSFDFLQKMILHFPSFNIEWLMTGKGKPYKDGSTNKTTEPDGRENRVTSTMSTLFPQNDTPINQTMGSQSSSGDSDTTYMENKTKVEIDPQKNIEPHESMESCNKTFDIPRVTDQNSQNHPCENSKFVPASDNDVHFVKDEPMSTRENCHHSKQSPHSDAIDDRRHIIRITVFYSDGTFEEKS